MLSSAFGGIMHLFRASIVFDNIEDMYMYKKVVLVKPLDSETQATTPSHHAFRLLIHLVFCLHSIPLHKVRYQDDSNAYCE